MAQELLHSLHLTVQIYKPLNSLVGTYILVLDLWKMWVLFEWKKLKLWNKKNFVENRDYAGCLKNSVSFGPA